MDAAADGDDGYAFAFLEHFTHADRQWRWRLRQRNAEAHAARIPYRQRGIEMQRRVHGSLKVGLVTRGDDAHVRDVAQERQVEGPMMGRPVLAHQSGAIEAQHHGQFLDAHVVHYLVVGTLQERGIDGDEGAITLNGETGGEGDGVLLTDAHIHEPVGMPLAETVRTRPFRHGCRDGNDTLIHVGKTAQRLAEHLGIGGHHGGIAGLACPARLRFESAHTVEERRVGLGRGIALSLAGEHMQQHGPVVGLRQFEVTDQRLHIVPVHRPDVVELERLEQHPRGEEALQAVFAALGVGDHLVADAGNGLEGRLHIAFDATRPPLGQVAAEEQRERPHVPRDGHLVVIEDDDEPPAHVTSLIQPLEGQPGRERTVADDGHHMMIIPGEVTRQGHAQCRRDGRGGMPHPEMVVLALARLRKAADAMPAAQGVEIGRPAREKLPCVGLMPHIPDDLVLAGVECGEHRQREFHNAE